MWKNLLTSSRSNVKYTSWFQEGCEEQSVAD